MYFNGLPGGSVVKNPTINAGDSRDTASSPESGRVSGGGNGNPLQCSHLKKSHGQKSLAGYSPWVTKSRTWLSDAARNVLKTPLPPPFFKKGLRVNSSVDKETACSAGEPGSIPGLGRSPGEGTGYPLQHSWASFLAQLVKKPPAVWETSVRSLGWEDSLEKGKATHSSILAWRIPWTVQSMGSQSWTWLTDFHFRSQIRIHIP